MQDSEHAPVAIATLRTVRPRGGPPVAVMRVANVFIKALLRSPLHGVASKRLLILDYTGRKSGRRYSFPLVYRRDGEVVTLIAGNPWWINVRGGGAVTLRIAGADVRGIATPVEDRGRAERALLALLEEVPRLAKMYNATLTPDGRPDRRGVGAAIETQVAVLVRLDGAAPAD